MEVHPRGTELVIREKRKNKHTNRASKQLTYMADFIAVDIIYENRCCPVQNINLYRRNHPKLTKIQNDDEILHNYILHVSKKEYNKVMLDPKNTQQRFRRKNWIRTNRNKKDFVQKTSSLNRIRNNTIENFKKKYWCGIDNLLVFFMLAKLMYETSKRLQYIAQLAHTTQYVVREKIQSNFFVITIESSQLKKLLYPLLDLMSNGNIIQRLFYEQDNRGWEINNKTLEIMNAKVKHSVAFNICVEKNSIQFTIALWKIFTLSINILDVIQRFLSISKTIGENNEANNVPSLCIRNWNFQDIVQGYMLGILLRSSKVNTLNYMRKLYYVIITGANPNLVIEMNIKLKNGIFMVYDNCLYQEINRWSKSMSMATLEKRFINIYRQDKKTEAITFTSLYHSELNIGKGKANCLEAESRTESNDELYKTKSLSDCESLQTKLSRSSTFSLQKVNGSTSLRAVDDEACKVVPTCHARKQENVSLISNIFEKNHKMYNSYYLHSKKWVTGIFKGSKEVQNNTRVIFHYQQLKEMVFDKALIQKHLQTAVDLYWEHVTSQSFYSLLIKSLGQSMVNIFCCTVIT